MNTVLEVARVSLCLIFFLYASWSDYKTREVSNTVWMVLAPLALALTSIQFLAFSRESLDTFVLSFVLTSVLSIVLFYAGAFGGADAKALICLALALPLYPVVIQPLFGLISPIFPITVFTNAVLLAVVSVFYSIARNCLWRLRTGKRLFEGLEDASLGRKISAFLCGYRIDITELEKAEHSYPLEDISTTDAGEPKRRLLVFPKDEERTEIINRISKAAKEGTLPKEIWTTPGLPMLIFITVGLIVALFLGDILWIILGSALSYA